MCIFWIGTRFLELNYYGSAFLKRYRRKRAKQTKRCHSRSNTKRRRLHILHRNYYGLIIIIRYNHWHPTVSKKPTKTPTNQTYWRFPLVLWIAANAQFNKNTLFCQSPWEWLDFVYRSNQLGDRTVILDLNKFECTNRYFESTTKN